MRVVGVSVVALVLLTVVGQLPPIFVVFADDDVTSAPGGDPKGERNQAKTSKLPRGRGLAAKFPGDRGLASHDAVVFVADFERDDWRERWGSATEAKPGNDPLGRVDLSATSPLVGRRSLRVTAELGKNHGGGLTHWFRPSERIHIRFYTRFDEKCDYVHHFCTLRANQSWERGKEKWSGFGGAGVRPQGDERFSTAIEPWGDWGRSPPPGRWNFYSYWHTMTNPHEGKYWGNAFRPAKQPTIQRGRWYCVEFMLDHNTPGKNDGEQAYWIDGELGGHWSDINWRKSPDLWANAFTLESYITDRWTKNPVNIVYFDNVVIAREYIGPTVVLSEKEKPPEKKSEPSGRTGSAGGGGGVR